MTKRVGKSMFFESLSTSGEIGEGVVSQFQLFSGQPLRPSRLCGELLAVRIHRRGAENAELTQRVSQTRIQPVTELCGQDPDDDLE